LEPIDEAILIRFIKEILIKCYPKNLKTGYDRAKAMYSTGVGATASMPELYFDRAP
jgi:hypothetical protein